MMAFIGGDNAVKLAGICKLVGSHLGYSVCHRQPA